MLPILFPLVAAPIFCIKISTVVNKHVFSSPGAILRHQAVLKERFFLHHRTFFSRPWLKGGKVLPWLRQRRLAQGWGRPWASRGAQIFCPAEALGEEQEFPGHTVSHRSPWRCLDFPWSSERCRGLPKPSPPTPFPAPSLSSAGNRRQRMKRLGAIRIPRVASSCPLQHGDAAA